MKFYITGTRRGLGKYLADNLVCVDSLEQCDVFINCKHDQFTQVDMLYQAVRLGKRVINIGSAASDWTYGTEWKAMAYAIEKKALREANKQLYWEGANTTCINFGFFDSERSLEFDLPKMTIEYCADVIQWILAQPYRVQEITVTP